MSVESTRPFYSDAVGHTADGREVYFGDVFNKFLDELVSATTTAAVSVGNQFMDITDGAGIYGALVGSNPYLTSRAYTAGTALVFGNGQALNQDGNGFFEVSANRIQTDGNYSNYVFVSYQTGAATRIIYVTGGWGSYNTLGGPIDGINTAYNLGAYTSGKLLTLRNGLALSQAYWSETNPGNGIIDLNNPVSGGFLMAVHDPNWFIDSSDGVGSYGQLTGAFDGVNREYSVSNPNLIPETQIVFWNGQALSSDNWERLDTGFKLDSPITSGILMDSYETT